MPDKTAVVLLSGGLDSATAFAVALSEGYACHCLSFDYGQKNRNELNAARRIAAGRAVTHRVVTIFPSAFGGSAMTADSVDVPKNSKMGDNIPVTYVPARNTIFLSYGLALAEVVEADALFIGTEALQPKAYCTNPGL